MSDNQTHILDRKPESIPASLWQGAMETKVRIASTEQMEELFIQMTGRESEDVGGLMGLYLAHVQTVVLWEHCNEYKEAEILLHELAHSFFIERSLEHEEGHVDAVAQGILNLLVDNPSFCTWLFQRVAQIRNKKNPSTNHYLHPDYKKNLENSLKK